MTMSHVYSTGFHGALDEDLTTTRANQQIAGWDWKLTYRFYPHFHPYVTELAKRLIEKSVAGLQAADTEKPPLFEELFNKQNYDPVPPPTKDATTGVFVDDRYPVKELDFSSRGAYAVYNWELFFHVPLTIAIHLSKNQRFEEARRWFHYIFDPTDNSDDATPQRFWKVKPFYETTDVQSIEQLLDNLLTSKGTGNDEKKDEDLRADINNCIREWQNNPFRPHLVARYRPSAYMYKTVMAYLDNLIAWGDTLFREDTGESINEAMQLYVIAANLLGPRPQVVPKKRSLSPQTYASLRQSWGAAQVGVESNIPSNSSPPPDEVADTGPLSILSSLALYFCVPPNDKLLSYWDTVADRLFKIRNSLNIQGIFRQLPLYEPPIDPALLARATAAGLDVGAVISGVNQPLPLVRFQLLVQKAAEICQEVKSLGNNLLSAMEKEDGEAMAILRAKHERAVMEMVEHVKYGQLQEAIKSREGLIESLALAVLRYTYYERQLGKKTDEIAKAIPQLEELDKESLEKMKFAMKEPGVGMREIEVDIAQDLGASGGKIISSYELQEISKLADARGEQATAAEKDRWGAGLGLIPDISINIEPLGVGETTTFGGSTASRAMAFWASFGRATAERMSYEAGNASRIAGYARRQQDWAFQSNLAAGEITQIFKQLRAAQIREAIAELELKNHRRQMKHAEEIEHFLNAEGTEKTGKKTNKALYVWMKREVKGLYAQCFQFAFDIAKKAERALQHELGKPELSYLQFGYLAGKEGLLAGEKLYLDLKRMEMAYHDLNQREYELTKHVSLLQVNPLALIDLRTTGRCTVNLPEALFDLDGPGHYFRRIKTVALSIPCVTGPYASVNCTLTLLKSSIRKTPILRDGKYIRDDKGAEDNRFSDYSGSLQSIVTSSAQNDSGMFETNLRDERYLPFENSGAISEWQLQLPANPSSKGELQQFDYDTISDVILHVRYTARPGVEPGAVKKELDGLFNKANLALLFSLRHDFPAEWSAFVKGTGDSPFTATIRKERFPYFTHEKDITITKLDLCGGTKSTKTCAVGNKDAATTDLANQSQFTLTAKPDNQILTRKAKQVYLIIGYTIG